MNKSSAEEPRGHEGPRTPHKEHGQQEQRERGRPEAAGHDLVTATARRIIASDAPIIHRLGTI
ncbi:hypothetical protein KGQ20_31090 [Catenulispora sp. NF23]|uniref:hypothetical protein n=1 Tax=Catenulispora pinistramenti TaxID=2705254 RepID=UPI001BA6952C|nr:hypothetical protein [Catenulispora pinistramenti]MBS2537211.1 hypothetical protein [Catenulispora pinistramenti]